MIIIKNDNKVIRMFIKTHIPDCFNDQEKRDKIKCCKIVLGNLNNNDGAK